jgi:hypothetical protein
MDRAAGRRAAAFDGAIAIHGGACTCGAADRNVVADRHVAMILGSSGSESKTINDYLPDTRPPTSDRGRRFNDSDEISKCRVYVRSLSI